MTSSSQTPSSVFFNEPSELSYLNSLDLPLCPLYFPERVVKEIKKKTTIFNTESLVFEELENIDTVNCVINARCLEEDADQSETKTKYIFNCCSGSICKCCLLHNIKTNPNYKRCPFCRNPNFCPTIQSTTQSIVIGNSLTPITQRQINRYRDEITILLGFKDNFEYFNTYILDKKIEDLTPYQIYYWNVINLLASDIFGFDDYEIADRFYLITGGLLSDLTAIGFDTPQNYQSLNEEISFVFRDSYANWGPSDTYYRVDIDLLSSEGVVDRLLDTLKESPTLFSKHFIFDNCITSGFKIGFGDNGADDEVYTQMFNDAYDRLLGQMLKDDNELKIILKDYYLSNYSDEVIGEVLGVYQFGEIQTHNVAENGTIDRDYRYFLLSKWDILD
jgi:hypothetical protein